MALAHSPRIVTDGLVLALDAANTKSYPGSGTTWTDLSGAGHYGTLINGPTYGNGAIVFDGINDYVQCSGSAITTAAATFLAWIRRSGAQDSYDGIIFSRGSVTTGMGFLGTTNKISYTWNDAGQTYGWDSGLTIPDLTWCMIAVSVSSTAATAYLCQSSGISFATNTAYTHTSTTLDDIKIGQDDFGSRLFTGSMAMAMVYNRALSSTEIQQNFNAHRSRFGL